MPETPNLTPKTAPPPQYREGHRIVDASTGQAVTLTPRPDGRADLVVRAQYGVPPSTAAVAPAELRELAAAMVDVADALDKAGQAGG